MLRVNLNPAALPVTGPGRSATVVIALLVLAGAVGCSETAQKNLFEPEVGHPATWVADHGSAALSEGDSCPDCHGTDLGGGVSGLSCFSLAFNEGSCHESGGGTRHTTGWSLPGEHGRAVKSRPGVSAGMGSCRACHGPDYGGGTSEVSCSRCHDVPAPHPAGPWLGAFSGHEQTHELNAPFCSDCHRNDESLDSPGCFNGSLCHGEKGIHSIEWALPDNHGHEAVTGPLEGGFEECAICHGEDFSGGTSGVSCFTCHEIDAPHGKSWNGGGEGHRNVNENNAVTCAPCHGEPGAPPGCFTANECHSGGAENPAALEEPVPPEEPAPPEYQPPPEEPVPPEETPPDEEPPL